ncbi:hypothetical protein [Flavobacterium sp.]|uniref:hypothetical protein n=1 Tax=Flavobacterium sp. TaxID=239 RepID=UPI0022BB67ED|nr:hypothetical protein [Flavobacterium sp.]MCZ8169294.1 hypothetical protein [Flavobacterium sp.]
MSTVELKNELHHIIEKGDAAFLKKIYGLLKDQILLEENHKLINESEKDILEGKIHSQNEVQKIIEGWKE